LSGDYLFLYPKAQEHIQNFAPINVHNGNNQSLIVFFLYYGMLLFQKAPYQVQDNARLSANPANGKAAKAGLIAKAKVIADDADKKKWVNLLQRQRRRAFDYICDCFPWIRTRKHIN
jgi:hypothetical protein